MITVDSLHPRTVVAWNFLEAADTRRNIQKGTVPDTSSLISVNYKTITLIDHYTIISNTLP